MPIIIILVGFLLVCFEPIFHRNKVLVFKTVKKNCKRQERNPQKVKSRKACGLTILRKVHKLTQPVSCISCISPVTFTKIVSGPAALEVLCMGPNMA